MSSGSVRSPLLLQPTLIGVDQRRLAGAAFCLKHRGRQRLVLSGHVFPFAGFCVDRIGLAPIGQRFDGSGEHEQVSTCGWCRGVGSAKPLDMRDDVLLLRPEVPVEQLTARDDPVVVGDVVELLDKAPTLDAGWRREAGLVVYADDRALCVLLHRLIPGRGQSGCPAVFANTQQVVGSVARGATHQGRTLLWLTPVAAIESAIATGTPAEPLKQLSMRFGTALAPSELVDGATLRRA